MTPSPLPPDVFAALPPAVQAYIRSLEAVAAQVAALQARVAELEARLGQDSSNSSKPPSSDGPQVKPAPPRTPSGKTRGGQPGHPKHERAILPPDEVIDHKPTHCRRCATPIAGEDPDPIVDPVLDLPVRLRHVVHHRRHTLACPNCHAPTTAAPVPQASTGFGPKLTATVAYLSGVGRLSKRAVRTLLADVCDLPVSLGAVSKLEQTVSRALAPVHAAAHAAAKGADANVDETGWKQGTAKAWLWVAVTATRDRVPDPPEPQPGRLRRPGRADPGGAHDRPVRGVHAPDRDTPAGLLGPPAAGLPGDDRPAECGGRDRAGVARPTPTSCSTTGRRSGTGRGPGGGSGGRTWAGCGRR